MMRTGLQAIPSRISHPSCPFTSDDIEHYIIESRICRPCVYIYNAHTYIQTYTHTHIHTQRHTCMHAYIHAYIHTYIHTHIHTYTHTDMHACMHTYMHTYIHTYMLHLFNFLCCMCMHISQLVISTLTLWYVYIYNMHIYICI